MKAFSTVAVLLATATLGACTKTNDVETLHGEAVTMSRYYAPRVDSLDARLQAIFKRGSTIPASVPGVDAVSTRLTSARDVVLTLHQTVTPGPDGKSAFEKEADEAAKARNIERLESMLHEKEETLSRGVTIANDDLSAAEAWIAQYDRHTLAMPAAPAQPTQPLQPVTEGAAGTAGAPAPGGNGTTPTPPPGAGSGSAATPTPEPGAGHGPNAMGDHAGAGHGSAAPAEHPGAGHGSAAPAAHPHH